MDLLTGSQLFHIIQRTLNRVDERLMGHGERVAVVMYQVLRGLPTIERLQLSRLCLMGLMHDIGAYKTEEIDDLLQFEKQGVWNHAVYGYLFLKKLSPFQEDALPVLYHHLPFMSYASAEPPLLEDDFAGLIYLADRIDMVVLEKGPSFCYDWLKRCRGTLFSPYWLDLFFHAEQQFGILSQLEARHYAPALEDMISRLELCPDEIRQYLSVIAYAIDFRSEFMVLHTVTTVSVSEVLGAKLNLSAEDREALYYGALLHDIGKVASPVEILEKPGKLTPDEMNIMRHHVSVTREILDGFIDSKVLNIAVRHHEKLDGTGYPDGLAANSLTCAERIAAVADIVSALIRRRSYKDAFDKQKTMQILENMRDAGQICPITTNIMLDNFDQIVHTAEQLGEQITYAYTSIHNNYISLLSKMPLTA